MNKKVKYGLIILLTLIIIAIPLVGLAGHEFAGTDDQAVGLIENLNKDYQPWFQSFFEITDEMESIFFTLQAAIGAFILGITLGKITSKKQIEE